MPDTEKRLILMVDDDAQILESARDILEEAGYRVTSVGTAAAALAAFDQETPEVVVADFQLPDATGLEIARKVRERNEFTPVILMTGHASLEMAVQAIQEAVYDYLIKPVDPAQLTRTIGRAIDQERLTRENRQLLDDLKRTNEKMARLDTLKSRMLKILSHDLRTPLSSIRGYSELLRSGVKGKLTEAQKKMVDITMQESDHLNGLIGDLLDLAQLEAGTLHLDLRPTSMDVILNRVTQRVKLISEMKEVPVEIIVGSDLPLVNVDAPRLVQVISNLVRGALKHSSRGGRVFIHVGEKERSLDLRISYAGMGFTPEQLQGLFGVLNGALGEPASALDGLRISLALAKEILVAHGGQLGVESRGETQGATFWMTLPANQAASE